MIILYQNKYFTRHFQPTTPPDSCRSLVFLIAWCFISCVGLWLVLHLFLSKWCPLDNRYRHSCARAHACITHTKREREHRSVWCNCSNNNKTCFVLCVSDGARVAGSTPIEILLRSNFKLVINDKEYVVTPPDIRRFAHSFLIFNFFSSHLMMFLEPLTCWLQERESILYFIFSCERDIVDTNI